MNGAIALVSAPVERSFSYLRVKATCERKCVKNVSVLFVAFGFSKIIKSNKKPMFYMITLPKRSFVKLEQLLFSGII